jgi:hypothetical protein
MTTATPTPTPIVKATRTTTRNAKVAADSAKLAESLNGNPETETNPETGRKRAVTKATPVTNGTVRKVPASTPVKDANGKPIIVATPKQAIAKADSSGKVTIVPAKPAPDLKTAAKAAPETKAEPKKMPASRNLPRELVTLVAAAYAEASDADKQRIANYLKIVTTGTDEDGRRWWPADFPRPTHFSWA